MRSRFWSGQGLGEVEMTYRQRERGVSEDDERGHTSSALLPGQRRLRGVERHLLCGLLGGGGGVIRWW